MSRLISCCTRSVVIACRTELNTRCRTPSARAASTTARPMARSRGWMVGPTWYTFCTPSMALASTAGSLMSPTTISGTPRARSCAADASVRTQARTGCPAASSFGTSSLP